MRCTPPGRLMIQQGIAALRLGHGRWHEEERGEGGARARPDWRLGSRAEASQERLGGAAVRADVARPAHGAPGATELRHDRVDRRRASVRRAGPRGWHQRNGTGGRGWEALSRGRLHPGRRRQRRPEPTHRARRRALRHAHRGLDQAPRPPGAARVHEGDCLGLCDLRGRRGLH